MKKPQILNHNTTKKKTSKFPVDQYIDLFTLRSKPVSLAFIENLAAELITWARDDEDALKMTQFYRLKGLCDKDVARWTKRSKKLKAAKEFALTAVGDRREIGALKNKLNANIVMSQMAKYDKSWAKLEKERAELKATLREKEEEKSVVFKIVQQPIEEKK